MSPRSFPNGLALRIHATTLAIALSAALSACNDSGSADVLMAVYPNDTCFVAGSTLSGETADRCCEMGAAESPYLSNGIYNRSQATRAYAQACEQAHDGCQTTCQGEGGDMPCSDSACVGQCYDEGSRKAEQEYTRLSETASNPKQPKNPYPASCPQPPGFTPSTSNIATFNATAQAARTSLQAAEALVGVAPSSTGLGTSAATASDSPAAGASRPVEAIAAFPAPGTTASSHGNQARGGAGSGGAPAAGGAIGSLNGSISTAPIDPDSRDTRGAGASAALGESPGTTYSRGGGGGGAAARPDGNGLVSDSQWAMLIGNAAKGGKNAPNSGVTEVKFGAGAIGSPGAINPAAQQDPADYFNRLKPHDNLFKVVERRYRGKSRELERR